MTKIIKILARYIKVSLWEQGLRDQVQVMEEELRNLEAKPKTPKGPPVLFDLETATWSGVSEKKMALWKAAYPEINLEIEMAEAAAWLDARPARAHKQDFSIFLVRWFARSKKRKAWLASKPTPGRPCASESMADFDRRQQLQKASGEAR